MPNEKSVRLHEKFGFREVANYEHVGFKHGRWLDVKWYGMALAPTSEAAGGETAPKQPKPPTPFSEIERSAAMRGIFDRTIEEFIFMK